MTDRQHRHHELARQMTVAINAKDGSRLSELLAQVKAEGIWCCIRPTEGTDDDCFCTYEALEQFALDALASEVAGSKA